MFTEFHGLSENPFTIIPSPRLAWLGAGVRKVRAELCEAVLEGRGLLLLTGGPGVGKSLALTLLGNELERIGASCRIHTLNCGVQASATELLRCIPEDAAGDDDAAATDGLTVLLVDEAQHLCSAELAALLHAIALRADCLCLVLAGAPKLELAVNEALAEHPVTVATHWSLEALQPAEISSYIAGRLQAAGGGGREIFTAGAIECLARHSGGVPRRLNVLCSTALFLAWREGRQDVDASIVEAALSAISPRGSLTDVTEPRLAAPVPTSTHRPLIEAAVSLQGEDAPMPEFEPAAFKVSVEPATLDDAQPELVESVTTRAGQSESVAPQTNLPGPAAPGPGAARLEIWEHATDVAVAATPVSREIAQLQPKAKAVARQHRPVLVLIWSLIRRRPTLYVSVAGVAAIVFLLVAISWRPRDEQQAGHANAPMTAEAIVPAEPSIIATTNQPPAPSQNPAPAVTEPEPPEASPARAMQRANAYVPQNDRQGASAAEGQTPETMGPVELAELLARARQQIKAFALTTPAGDNAFETLQRVLAAMPAQPDALHGIQDIASRYALLAAQADRRGEHDLAGRYVDKGLDVVPDHPDLLALRQKLAAQPASPPGANLSTDQSAWITSLVEKLQRGHQQPH